MALSQGLYQKQLQKLSPQQIQLMKLLQVPTALLEERIKEEMEENPALEEAEEGHEDEYDETNDEFKDKETEDAELDGSEDEYDNIDITEYVNDGDDEVGDYKLKDDNYPEIDESRVIPTKVERGFNELMLEQLGMLSLTEQQQRRAVARTAELARHQQTHVQQEEGQHALEKVARERLHDDAAGLAASPRPLDASITEGRFRSELYYMLSRTTLYVPPLSERCEDIPILAAHFLGNASPGKTLAPDAILALEEGNWPGNVRQLKNIIEQVSTGNLTEIITKAAVRRAMRELDDESLIALDDARRDFERDYLIRLLQNTAGNVSQAARIAQRNRTEFYKLLARHELDPVNFKQRFK